VRTCRPLPTHAGIIIIVVIGTAVAAIFLGGGEQAPFLGLSKLGPQGKITSSVGAPTSTTTYASHRRHAAPSASRR
jgi:hypothetical protein